MYVLGIETSCDECGAAVVENGSRILSSVVSSSLKFHKLYGGVVPEIASRMQLEAIAPVTEAAIKEAGVSLKDLGLLSVTSSPGLVGSLLVGLGFAKAMGLALKIPLLGLDHIHSHIWANFLNYQAGCNGLKMPFIALVVSGGHTSLFYVADFGRIKLMGSTLDDACGEAFDKVAKILSLGYPGGPQIERLAKKGNPKKIKFACSNTDRPLDFSFSGIKTAVLYRVQGTGYRVQDKSDIAASFQESVIDTLIQKSLLACKLKKVKKLVIGGGVAANQRLREKFYLSTKEKGISCHFPPKELCMDNAAMVAGLGYHLFKKEGEKKCLQTYR